jgi:DNA-binding response OmpR family regulator
VSDALSTRHAAESYVLIQNDSQPQAELLREIVSLATALDIMLTANPLDALEFIHRSPPVLVITDLNHPALSGEEFISRLRRKCPSVPILVATGDTASRQQRALAAGANQAIGAPFKYETVVAAVRALLTSRSSSGPAG